MDGMLERWRGRLLAAWEPLFPLLFVAAPTIHFLLCSCPSAPLRPFSALPIRSLEQRKEEKLPVRTAPVSASIRFYN